MHLSASMLQRGGEHNVVGRDRDALEDMIESMLQSGLGGDGLGLGFVEVGLFADLCDS
jgi:hypothetical protein